MSRWKPPGSPRRGVSATAQASGQKSRVVRRPGPGGRGADCYVWREGSWQLSPHVHAPGDSDTRDTRDGASSRLRPPRQPWVGRHLPQCQHLRRGSAGATSGSGGPEDAGCPEQAPRHPVARIPLRLDPDMLPPPRSLRWARPVERCRAAHGGGGGGLCGVLAGTSEFPPISWRRREGPCLLHRTGPGGFRGLAASRSVQSQGCWQPSLPWVGPGSSRLLL